MILIYLLKNNKRLTQEDINFFGADLSLRLITNCVCYYYNIAFEDIGKKSNERHFVEPRQIISYLAKENNIASYSTIASYLRPLKPFNHATIWHGRRNIEMLLKNDKYIQKVVRDINRLLWKV